MSAHEIVVESDWDSGYVLCTRCKRRFNIFDDAEYDAARFDECEGRP